MFRVVTLSVCGIHPGTARALGVGPEDRTLQAGWGA